MRSIRLSATHIAVALALAVESLALWPSWSSAAAAFFGRRGRYDASDFSAFYGAASLILHGHGPDVIKPAALVASEHAHVALPPGHVLPYLNPPFFALLLTPLNALPFSAAYQTWSVVNLGLLAICSALIWHIASNVGRGTRAALIGGFVTAYPVSYSVRQGQFTLLLVLGMAAAYLLLRSGRDRAAGASLALLLIKPELLLPFAAYLAWQRRWRVFQALLPLTALAVLASLAVIGPAGAVRYPHYLLTTSSHNVPGTFTSNMYSWIGVFGAAFGPQHTGAEFVAHACATVIMGVFAVIVCHGERSERALVRCWCVAACCALLADPHLYVQDTILIAPAAIALFEAEDGVRRTAVGAWLAAGWLAMAAGVNPNPQWHANPFAIVLAGGAVALVGTMLVAQARDVRRQRATGGGRQQPDEVTRRRAA